MRIAVFLFLVSFNLVFIGVVAQSPLPNGRPVEGSVSFSKCQNYTFIINSESSVSILDVKTLTGSIYTFAAVNRVPTFEDHDWKDVTNGTEKRWEISKSHRQIGKVLVCVFGASKSQMSTFQIQATSVDGAIHDRQVVYGTVVSTLTYLLNVPQNITTLQLYATASGPNAADQYLGHGFIPTTGPKSDATYFNQSFTTPDSCIYALNPPPGDWYYELSAYDNLTISFKTQVIFNAPKSCQIEHEKVENNRSRGKSMEHDAIQRMVEDLRGH